jgi:hypothetical protein
LKLPHQVIYERLQNEQIGPPTFSLNERGRQEGGPPITYLNEAQSACGPPIRQKANPCKAKDHHGPSGGFWNGGHGQAILLKIRDGATSNVEMSRHYNLPKGGLSEEKIVAVLT